MRPLVLFSLLIVLGLFGWIGSQQTNPATADQPTSSAERIRYQTGESELLAMIPAAGRVEDQIALDKRVEGSQGVIVSHHVPTALPAIMTGYRTLAAGLVPSTIKRIIVVGPDHRDRATHPFVTTRGLFGTPFGTLAVDQEAVSQLLREGLVDLEEEPFQAEHSIGVQAILGRYFFPKAEIVPIVIRSSATADQAAALGLLLAQLINSETVMVASVDFSHYFGEDQARALDQESASRLIENTPATVRLVRSDSTQSLIALKTAMDRVGRGEFTLLRVDNSAEWTGNRNWTTGYVTGIYHQTEPQ